MYVHSKGVKYFWFQISYYFEFHMQGPENISNYAKLVSNIGCSNSFNIFFYHHPSSLLKLKPYNRVII